MFRSANITLLKTAQKLLFPWTKYKLFCINKNTMELNLECQIHLPGRLRWFNPKLNSSHKISDISVPGNNTKRTDRILASLTPSHCYKIPRSSMVIWINLFFPLSRHPISQLSTAKAIFYQHFILSYSILLFICCAGQANICMCSKILLLTFNPPSLKFITASHL